MATIATIVRIRFMGHSSGFVYAGFPTASRGREKEADPRGEKISVHIAIRATGGPFARGTGNWRRWKITAAPTV
jgi:hypothetical protein